MPRLLISHRWTEWLPFSRPKDEQGLFLPFCRCRSPLQNCTEHPKNERPEYHIIPQTLPNPSFPPQTTRRPKGQNTAHSLGPGTESRPSPSCSRRKTSRAAPFRSVLRVPSSPPETRGMERTPFLGPPGSWAPPGGVVSGTPSKPRPVTARAWRFRGLGWPASGNRGHGGSSCRGFEN